MKKIALFFACCYFFNAFLLFANEKSPNVFPNEQPVEFYLEATDTVIRGETLCVKFKTRGFTDITKFQFNLTYNIYGLIDDQLIAGDLPGTPTITSLNSNVAVLRYAWQSPTGAGVTLPDNSTMFEICYSATQTTVTQGRFSFVRYPSPASTFAINSAEESVPVSTFNEDYIVLPSDAIALFVTDTVIAPGESACMQVGVKNFDGKLLAMQYSMGWDTSVLQFDSLINLNLPFASLERSFNLGITPLGKLAFLWDDQPPFEGIRLPRGTVLYELCFTAKGTEGQSSAIRFTAEPTAQEFIDSAFNYLNFENTPGSITISNDPIMRPGDTNNDGVVNNFDLLNIGLGYGYFGPARSTTSEAWMPQPAVDWNAYSPVSGLNFKHFDADGNGLIERSDAAAIDNNWGLSVEDGLNAPVIAQPREEGAPLYLQTTTISPGEDVRFDLMLGNADQMTSAYGIAFSIVYDPEVRTVIDNSVAVTFPESWLGIPNEDMLVFQRNNPEARRIDIALVRTNSENRFGYGSIGTLHFSTFAEGGLLDSTSFTIENVRMINASEVDLPVSPATATVFVTTTGTYDPVIAQQIKLFPNPASEVLQVQSAGLKIQQIDCLDLNGRLLARYQNETQIPVQDLAAGTYWLRIITDQGVASKRFVK